jgi:unsaturated rhamnogalacturonyl hydrolase
VTRQAPLPCSPPPLSPQAALYELAPADYKLSLAVTIDKAIATLKPYSWWWVDCLFMTQGALMHLGKLLQDTRVWDLAFSQYSDITTGGPAGPATQPSLWDDDADLYHRDQTYINKTDKNGKKIFWSRGDGWAAMSMASALPHLPVGHPYQVEYARRLQLLAAALAPLQGADGMWRASLLDAALIPNPETTGTACFTYAMAYGINSGVLDAATYTPIVAAAWQGLATIALQPSGLVGWCQPADGAPNPAVQTGTSDFCVGQFLLAASEVYKLAGGKV